MVAFPFSVLVLAPRDRLLLHNLSETIRHFLQALHLDFPLVSYAEDIIKHMLSVSNRLERLMEWLNLKLNYQFLHFVYQLCDLIVTTMDVRRYYVF